MSDPTPPSAVPPLRVRGANAAPVRPQGAHVLYWMTAYRRPAWNYALDRAVDWARALGRGLLVLEPLRCDYPWASPRLHRFVLQGMADNAAAFGAAGVPYHPYVEPAPGAGRGLLAALGADACVVVTDDWPCFFLPRMLAAAAQRLPVRLEAVDGNGLLPLRAAPRAFPTARGFRGHLQRTLPEHLGQAPHAKPPTAPLLPPAPHLPAAVAERWPAADAALLQGEPGALAALPLDAAVPPVAHRGGFRAGQALLQRFVRERLHAYAEEARHPDAEATSGLSPWLHFGHVSAHEVAQAVWAHEGWHPDRLADRATAGKAGQRAGWWGLSVAAEAFLEQLVTWRELSFNGCALQDAVTDYRSLPAWARRTLAVHADDPRPHRYSLAELEQARTDDPLWNAAQRQLLREGHIHNYLRMLWGKQVLAWSASPEEAWETLLHLNDRWAVDGRDPNSYSGIGWVFGRYDRAWGPERPIYGTVRYLSSANTARKLRLRGYLARYGT